MRRDHNIDDYVIGDIIHNLSTTLWIPIRVDMLKKLDVLVKTSA